jgi:hypothetical protein
MKLEEINQIGDELNSRVPKQYFGSTPKGIGMIYGTGWKCDVPKQKLSDEENNKLIAALKGPEDLGFVFQFIFYATASGPYFYLNLPSLTCGTYERGDNFDIGTQRIRYDITQKAMENMLAFGVVSLMTFIVKKRTLIFDKAASMR